MDTLCYNNTLSLLTRLMHNEYGSDGIYECYKNNLTIDNSAFIYDEVIALCKIKSFDNLADANFIFTIVLLKLILLGLYIVFCAIVINKYISKNKTLYTIILSIGQTASIGFSIILIATRILFFGLYYYFLYSHFNDRSCYK